MMGKNRHIVLSDDDGDEDRDQELRRPQKRRKGAGLREEERVEEPKPLGNVMRVSGKGKDLRRHYASLEVAGDVYELGDSVLLSHDGEKKPFIAIIKDITEDADGDVMVTGQWFYRPEETQKEGGGNWEARDSREIFYSFHFDEIPAESVMHKCVIHFIPLHKQLPDRSRYPGFIVQKIYDPFEKKLWKLMDKDYHESKQHELDTLVEQTRSQIGELPDILLDTSCAKKSENLKSERNLENKVCPVDVSRPEPTTRIDKLEKAYGSCRTDVSKYHEILSEFKVLTGDPYRDKWLEKLLQGIQTAWNSKDAAPMDDKYKNNGVSSGLRVAGKSSGLCGSYGSGSSAAVRICWPNAAIPIITTLERVTHEAMGIDFQKYNQKMRQLDFNIKSSAVLSRRLLNKELEPIALLTMTPAELKEGLTADERIILEPEKPKQMQMTEVRCSRCTEKQVGVTDIIQAGGRGERYQLECCACGHTWYASQDFIACIND